MNGSTRVGPYRLLRVIGEGGMGVVHLALDPHERAVAVKVVRPHVAADPETRARLAREVRSLIKVRHHRVAEVLDADFDAELPYVVMRYVPGEALDAAVRRDGPLRGEALGELAVGLIEAVAAIHDVGVVHRDLKPGNVLLLDGSPVVIDFGIARALDDVSLTSTGLMVGTPGYLSPEVLDGADVGTAADWWGWGAVVAYAATGRPPFRTGPMEAVWDRVRRGAVDLEGLDEDWSRVLAATLRPDPADRPPPEALVDAVAALTGRRARRPAGRLDVAPAGTVATGERPVAAVARARVDPVPATAVTPAVGPAPTPVDRTAVQPVVQTAVQPAVRPAAYGGDRTAVQPAVRPGTPGSDRTAVQPAVQPAVRTGATDRGPVRPGDRRVPPAAPVTRVVERPVPARPVAGGPPAGYDPPRLTVQPSVQPSVRSGARTPGSEVTGYGSGPGLPGSRPPEPRRGYGPAPVPALPSRPGLALLGLLGVAAVALVTPLGAAGLALAWASVARAVQWSRVAAAVSRSRSGRLGAGVRAGLTLMFPLRLVGSVLATLGYLVTGAAIVSPLLLLGAAFLLRDVPLGDWTTIRAVLAPPAVQSGLVVLGVLLAWVGPGGRAVREGSRAVSEPVARHRNGRLALAGLAALVVLAGVLVLGYGF